MIVQYVLTKCFSFHFSSVFLSLSSDFLCMYAHTFLRVEIQGEEVGAKFSKSQPPPPKFGILLHFFVTISNFFPIRVGLRGSGGGDDPLSPIYAHMCMHAFPTYYLGFSNWQTTMKKKLFH